jgi:hypothetical protein
MSKSGKPSSKGLGGAKQPTGIAKGAKTITSQVSKGKAPAPTPAPTGFQGASVTSRQRMKPATPIIGASRGQNTSFATINKARMKDTIKKLGM